MPETTAVGTAPNVDMSAVDASTPFDRDVDSHRVIGCYCCRCGETATILAEPGRTHDWDHARRHPTHVIDYWREDEP